jgi:NADPH:quinone reductase-like Zn-dependent oxidoreductase
MNAVPSNNSADTQLTEIILPGLVEPEGLVVSQRPIPAPSQGQAVVKMDATGVSFAEGSMRRGEYPGQPKFPFVPGYDLVGTVTAAGDGVDPSLVGRRVAAVTKTGGWATHNVIDARRLIPIADTLDPAEVETVLVNGLTAWQMLHRKAGVRPGQTILVHGASGGVGSILAQLARHDGIRVIGTGSPRHHDSLRQLGVEPLDYHSPDLSRQIRDLAPSGVAAAFDNIGGDSFKRSFDLLEEGGRLVGYGTASARDQGSNQIVAFAKILTSFAVWSVRSGGRRATFYNFWGGSRIQPARFQRRLAEDLGELLTLLSAGAIEPIIAGRYPLEEASAALRFAETRTTQGKVVLLPAV